MSKKAAIQLALATVLAWDKKPPLGLNAKLGGELPPTLNAIQDKADLEAVRIGVRLLTAFASSDGGYGAADLPSFFARVAFVLRSDDPPLKFNWSGVNFTEAANSPLHLLIETIAGLTTIVEDNRTEEKRPEQK